MRSVTACLISDTSTNPFPSYFTHRPLMHYVNKIKVASVLEWKVFVFVFVLAM